MSSSKGEIMEAKQKSVPSKSKNEKSSDVTSTHEVTPKVQTAEGWRRSVLRDSKKKK